MRRCLRMTLDLDSYNSGGSRLPSFATGSTTLSVSGRISCRLSKHTQNGPKGADDDRQQSVHSGGSSPGISRCWSSARSRLPHFYRRDGSVVATWLEISNGRDEPWTYRDGAP